MKTQLFLLSLVQIFLFLLKKMWVKLCSHWFWHFFKGFLSFCRRPHLFLALPAPRGSETQPGHLIYIISLSWVWRASHSSMKWSEFEEKHSSFILLLTPSLPFLVLICNLIYREKPGFYNPAWSHPVRAFSLRRLRAHQFHNNESIMTVPLVLLSPKSPFKDGDWVDKGQRFRKGRFRGDQPWKSALAHMSRT